MQINRSEMEQKWQKRWKDEGVYSTKEDANKKKFYVLDMFPYPSGAGLHVGHPKGYVASDVLARKKMLEGFSVLHPMGFDTFGLGTELYAIEKKMKPQVVSQQNIDYYKEQLKKIGFSYDWERSFSTAQPDYFKWTQWIFLQFYNHYYDEELDKAMPIERLEEKLKSEGIAGDELKNRLNAERLAYMDYKPINWCPHCQTGLANEDLADGKCERCGSPVEQKPMRQRVLRITKYAERLISGLDGLDWDESMKDLERNWIGRSEGTQFKMFVLPKDNDSKNCIIVHGQNESEEVSKKYGKENEKHRYGRLKQELEKMNISVSNPLFPNDWNPNYSQWKSEFEKNIIDENTILIGHSAGASFVLRYLQETKKKVDKVILVAPYLGKFNNDEAELHNFDLNGDVKNCFSELFILESDNDYDFCEKSTEVIGNKLSAKIIRIPGKGHFSDKFGVKQLPEILNLIKDHDSFEVFTTRVDTVFGMTFVVMAPEHPLVDKITTTEYKEAVEQYKQQAKFKTQLERTELQKEKTGQFTGAYAENPFNGAKIPVYIGDYVLANYGTGVVMAVPAHDERDFDFAHVHNIPIIQSIAPSDKNHPDYDAIARCEVCYPDKGVLVNSEDFTGKTSEEAIKAMQAWLAEHNLGGVKRNYKIQDWVFSRQRYWGEPFPLVLCPDCGVVPMKESDLPLLLPDVEHYEPTGTEEGPLADIDEWINVPCPHCGKPAKRESNTMPGWAGSSWYWLRYMDPKNDTKFVSSEAEQYWKSVDVYVGGAEHVTRHMIYARFWQKFLFDIGAVSEQEPFQRYEKVGLIMAEDGRKMSKRRGNVVNPDDVIAEFGADAFRTYEMFMGPFDQYISWNTNGLRGTRKFLDKVVALWDKVSPDAVLPEDVEILLNQTIKKTTEDIDAFRFNTSIAQFMILVNAFTECDNIPTKAFEDFIVLLAPFAPHLAEEFWSLLGHDFSIFKNGNWPVYDENKLTANSVKMAVQFNGKVRGTISIPKEATQDVAMEAVKADGKLSGYLISEPKKVIYVPGKILNIVL